MEKRANKYHLALTQLQTAKGEEDPKKHLEFDFENHDEVFQIVERLTEKDPFNDKRQATEFAVGLKLFSEAFLFA